MLYLIVNRNSNCLAKTFIDFNFSLGLYFMYSSVHFTVMTFMKLLAAVKKIQN